MPLEDLSEGAQRLLGYYGIIRAGTQAGESTAQIWDRIKAIPVENPPWAFFGAGNAVSELRGYASQVREASRVFGTQADYEPVGARAIANEPWSPSISGTAVPKQFTISFEHQTVNSAGDIETRWRTLRHVTNVDTKGDVMAQLNEAGEAFAADYGVDHSGIGAVEITVE